MQWAPSFQISRESNSARSLLPSCLICNPSISHTSSMLWKHGKCERSFFPGKCRGKGSSTGWSGQEAVEEASTVRTEQQAKPSHSTSSRSPCTQLTPRAPREASPPSKGLQWPPPGCHSRSHPGVFHACAQQRSSVRACPAHGGRWLQRHLEL